MIRFVEHRIADKRILRLIQKWLNAGVMEDGRWKASNRGTPQGATISPLLANIYLRLSTTIQRETPNRSSVTVSARRGTGPGCQPPDRARGAAA